MSAGVKIGSPVVYAPRAFALAGDRIVGTSVDDRAGCAVVAEVARLLAPIRQRPTIHFIFSTQEEYNLRGAMPAAQALKPDIAIQLDLMLATDTPDMHARGELAGDVVVATTMSNMRAVPMRRIRPARSS